MLCFKCSRNASADYNLESTASISFISETATVKDAALFKTVGRHQPEPFIRGKDGKHTRRWWCCGSPNAH